MISRVSQSYTTERFNMNLANRQEEMAKVENQLSSGFRVNLPSDDPVSAVQFMDYQSRIKQMDTYADIAAQSKDKLNLMDSSLNNATQLLHRSREIAVMAANGTYTQEDREMMAVEVDQMIRELAKVANSDYKGNALFGGTMVTDTPFKVYSEMDSRTGENVVTQVRYTGNFQSQVNEIEENERIEVNQPGNQVFWSDNMNMMSTLDVASYTASADSRIIVDGQDIRIQLGDNLETIANKINQSGAAVEALVENKNGKSYFSLQTTAPHQMMLMDADGGSVLEDLGLIEGGSVPPNNYASSAEVYTGSVFERLIEFREALQNNDIEKIGGQVLAGMDNSLSNILSYRARFGAVTERVESILNQFSADKVYLSDAKDRAVATDIPKAMTDLKMLEYSHQVALNIGGRMMPKTLLDFLR